MTEDAKPAVDIVALYGPFVAPDSLERLLRACEQVDDFRMLARRSSSARFMVEAIAAVSPSPAKLDDWIVKVTAHFLDALVDQEIPGTLESVAHEDFLLGQCRGWSCEEIDDRCPMRDGTDVSEWLEPTSYNEVGFTNILVRDIDTESAQTCFFLELPASPESES